MRVFGIIFYIIIFAVIAKAKKASKMNGEDKTKRNAVPDITIKDKSTTFNMPTKGRTSTPNVPTKGRTAVPNVPGKKKQKSVFMEPHKEEQYQPKIRTNNLWGEDEHASKRIVALRLMEGDPVPEGYVRVKCPYCAADNLVTKHCRQYHSCYFCRVPID